MSGGLGDRTRAPYTPQDPKEVGELLRALTDHTKGRKGKGDFTVRKKTFKLENGRTVDSWQMADWDYKKYDLPTQARGLFTHMNRKGQPEIAVRGYNKFFNVDEVNNTQWRNVENNTRGPYELSVKENGCIIFVAGLDDETLIITSKHSTGLRQDNSANHAAAGEKWVEQQLTNLGKSKADLAKQLRKMNATAVAELCDDEFEEHVLPYTPETAGLYLHGINLNLPEFATYSGNQVDIFADEWGFKKVQYVMKDDINEIKTFLEQVAETGNYAGRDTEGFVIRCQIREGKNAPWHDWFFKYKFEEPYLMYRQWREVTKSIIAGKAPRYKKHPKITEQYLNYARRQLAKDPKLGERFNKNHGIIEMRQGFLKEKGLKGSDIIRSELQEGGVDSMDVTKNVVLVPVATIGCGKTTIALALVKLFGWGHEQNDNIQGRQRRPQRFAEVCTKSLLTHPVVVADRNNHQRREREQIIHDIRMLFPDVRFVAMQYRHDRQDQEEIRKVTQGRVFSRGDNHQTIQAGSKTRDEIQGIMEGFLGRFESVDVSKPPDDAFDVVIDLDATATSRENLETVVNQLHDEYPKLFIMPSEEQLDIAIEAALHDYQPDIKHDLSHNGSGTKENHSHKTAKLDRQKQRDVKHERQINPDSIQPTHTNDVATIKRHSSKPKPVEYFCVSLPSDRMQAILDAIFQSAPEEMGHFYRQLKSIGRVQQAFHVTLMHRASIPQNPDYWNKLSDTLHQKNDQAIQAGTSLQHGETDIGHTRVQLERVVWDDRVMAIVVRLINSGEDGFFSTNEIAHITVGTAADGIKPKESNDLLRRWMAANADREGSPIKDIKVKGNVVLEGTVKAVLSRF